MGILWPLKLEVEVKSSGISKTVGVLSARWVAVAITSQTLQPYGFNSTVLMPCVILLRKYC